ncbi:dymeclin-like [Macadamia integrifolia]|uniref:dymeclin-like n=1 Tax=Macadamia integrifolia TaxID=60698 RepID=UPI001C4F1215|nr:dymeclin-like [Macadamia integrifolia]XP_042518040.1 dymeclin-like [Macadamia integrifolia]
MGAVPSTPRKNALPQDPAEYLIGAFVGEKSYPLTSDFWDELLELPLSLQWPHHRVRQACEIFGQNNHHTRHLAKILIHLVWCLQESMSTSAGPSLIHMKAVNAAYLSSIFLKYVIENSKGNSFEEFYLSLDEGEAVPENFHGDQNTENFAMHGVLSFIGMSDVSSHTYLLHHELLNLMLVAMSTQLCYAPSLGPKDVHPFLDAVIIQETSLVSLVVRKLLLNYITCPNFPLNGGSYSIFSGGSQLGVLQKVGSAAANFVLLPFSYLASSNGEGSGSPLAEDSLLVLLILIHYRKCIMVDESLLDKSEDDATMDSLLKDSSYFSENPYCKALENARDIELDRIDIEGNAHRGPLVRLPFASLFDTLGMHLADESSVLLLYSLVHGNSDFLEYVLVRTDLDTLLMPILETLYNASRRTSNQIYMLLIVLLILSQDSSFNGSIHKLILPSVPWYQERLLHHTSLGSLMVIILIRTVKYNLSKMRDVYLHTNCLATLANMAPHVHRLSAYASQRLVSLFDMLSRKYTKLAELRNDKMLMNKAGSIDGSNISEDASTELHIYTDFLRIVLEILNAILSYALPRNPEVVYAILQRQEVFQPYKNHPRFNELLENIYTVIDFFNSRMDAQRMDGEWSVEKVLQIIIINCRSWRGEGMKMFNQLRFTYEQENHPEEFFIPYVWQLVLSRSGFIFNPSAVNLFPVDMLVEEEQEASTVEEALKDETGESSV